MCKLEYFSHILITQIFAIWKLEYLSHILRKSSTRIYTICVSFNIYHVITFFKKIYAADKKIYATAGPTGPAKYQLCPMAEDHLVTYLPNTHQPKKFLTLGSSKFFILDLWKCLILGSRKNLISWSRMFLNLGPGNFYHGSRIISLTLLIWHPAICWPILLDWHANCSEEKEIRIENLKNHLMKMLSWHANSSQRNSNWKP